MLTRKRLGGYYYVAGFRTFKLGGFNLKKRLLDTTSPMYKAVFQIIANLKAMEAEEGKKGKQRNVYG